MSKQWGLLCPEGHGLLLAREDWTAAGVAWCPHADHGGNGRFYRAQEVVEGWFNPAAPRAETPEQVAVREALEAKATARQAAWEARTKAKAKAPAAPRAGRTAAIKEPKECLCGCGEFTKGGIFRPGHDARYHARLNREAADAAGNALLGIGQEVTDA